MRTVDLSPLYRSFIGFEHLASLNGCGGEYRQAAELSSLQHRSTRSRQIPESLWPLPDLATAS